MDGRRGHYYLLKNFKFFLKLLVWGRCLHFNAISKLQKLESWDWSRIVDNLKRITLMLVLIYLKSSICSILMKKFKSAGFVLHFHQCIFFLWKFWVREWTWSIISKIDSIYVNLRLMTMLNVNNLKDFMKKKRKITKISQFFPKISYFSHFFICQNM